jgi:hypothetical protein
MIAHVSDGGKVAVEPTYANAGQRKYSCTVCGTVLTTEEIPALGTTTKPVISVQESEQVQALLIQEDAEGVDYGSVSLDASINENLELQASSDSPTVATASIQNGKLTIYAVDAGIANITVSASVPDNFVKPDSVVITVAVAKIDFKGGSLRMDYADAKGAVDYSKTSMRMGYEITFPESLGTGENATSVTDISWNWGYGLTSEEAVSSKYKCEGKNSAAVNNSNARETNVVFTGIGSKSYSSTIYAQLSMSAKVNGKTVSWVDAVRSRNVKTVANSITTSGTANHDELEYADGILQEIAKLEKEEKWTLYY